MKQKAKIKKELKIHLRPLERRDIPKVVKWLMSPDYATNYVTDYPIRRQRDLKTQLLKEIALTKFIYAKTQVLVAEAAGDILVGVAMLKKIHWQSRHLELQIYIPSEFKQTNVTLLVTEQVYTYIFSNLNMHKVYSFVLGTNEQALKNHSSHNHEPEAVLYDYIFDGKKHQDLHIFAIYKKDILKQK